MCWSGQHPRGGPGAEGQLADQDEIDWFEGERFLIYRSHYDHPDIPDAIWIIGDTDGLQMHYFDTRGVHRIFKLTVTRAGTGDGDGPAGIGQRTAAFSQPITFTFEKDGRTTSGKARLSYDNESCDADLDATYHRAL